MASDYVHLSFEERALIETQLRLGMCASMIAKGLLRSCSTVTREMLRNGWKADRVSGRGGRRIAGGYRSIVAQRRARGLAAKPRMPRKLGPATEHWAVVADHLRKGLSPVQIASTLARMPQPVQLSAETIYTALYAMPRGQLRASLLDLTRRADLTRRGHQARRKQRRKSGPRKPPIPDMVLIDQRPGAA